MTPDTIKEVYEYFATKAEYIPIILYETEQQYVCFIVPKMTESIIMGGSSSSGPVTLNLKHHEKPLKCLDFRFANTNYISQLVYAVLHCNTSEVAVLNKTNSEFIYKLYTYINETPLFLEHCLKLLSTGGSATAYQSEWLFFLVKYTHYTKHKTYSLAFTPEEERFMFWANKSKILEKTMLQQLTELTSSKNTISINVSPIYKEAKKTVSMLLINTLQEELSKCDK